MLEKPQWLARSDWASYTPRNRARTEIEAAIAEVTRTQPAAFWVERLKRVGIPCGPIYRMDGVFAEPQVKHLGLAAPVVHPERGPTHLVASPINIEGCSRSIRSAASDAGAADGGVTFRVR